jgi:cytochrome bd-type quinol oxidase subunit 2
VGEYAADVLKGSDWLLVDAANNSDLELRRMVSRNAVIFLSLTALLTLGMPTTTIAQNAQDATLNPAETILVDGRVYMEDATQSWARPISSFFRRTFSRLIRAQLRRRKSSIVKTIVGGIVVYEVEAN